MKFIDFGLKKTLNEGLTNLGFTQPTSIQQKVIPLIKKHQKVIALAHTGTGKTYAFLLPIINNLDLTKKQVQALIIAPTRELAQQIATSVKPFSQIDNQITTGIFVGGSDINRDVELLNKNQPLIVVGTPTRLKELYLKKALQLTTANWVIVDECDMIFDLGFIEDVDFLLSKMKTDVEVSFFSATINQELQQYLKKYIQNTHLIDDSANQPSNKNIRHFLIETKNQEVNSTLLKIVASLNPYLCLIFVNQKKEIAPLVELFRKSGIKDVGELHGDLPPRNRKMMVKRIKNHEFKYVIVTDLAARGMDIADVSDVISLNLPFELNYYLHRAGRTGRANETGNSFVLDNITNKPKIDELKSQGIEFEVLKFVGDDLQLVVKKTKPAKKNLDPEMMKVLNKYQKAPVKPGYKKKRQAELEKIKKDRRRQHIKESINKIKKEKYKKRRKELFED
jgi:ATP-dependent RNA helicase CshB